MTRHLDSVTSKCFALLLVASVAISTSGCLWGESSCDDNVHVALGSDPAHIVPGTEQTLTLTFAQPVFDDPADVEGTIAKLAVIVAGGLNTDPRATRAMRIGGGNKDPGMKSVEVVDERRLRLTFEFPASEHPGPFKVSVLYGSLDDVCTRVVGSVSLPRKDE